MADRIRFGVNLTPIETLTDENGGTRDIVASEVGRSLSGSGESITISDYSAVADVQGYKDAAVNYRSASHASGGTALSTLEGDFFYIKNTGYKYSSATTLGAATTDCIFVAIQTAAYEDSVQNGWSNSNGTPQIHYFEIAFLKPGQAIILPLGADSLGISQFGANTGDFSTLNDQSSQNGTAKLIVKTVVAAGTAATTANAVEFLAVR